MTSITHELREYVDGHLCLGTTVLGGWKEAALALADRIDKELAERYVELPLDADGVPIHVGDDMETLMHGYEGEHSPVICIVLEGDGWTVDGDAPSSMLHYQPDSWERIIDDAELLAREWFNTDMSENEHAEGLDALVARCKALAGDV